MSTLKVNTIQDTSGGSGSTPAEIQQGRAKVWVNFQGSGTVAIQDSYNVSSITDSGTGKWFVNYSITMGNTNYTTCVGGYYDTGDSNGSTRPFYRRTALTTTQCGAIGANDGNNFGDLDRVWVTVFGD